MNVIKKIIAITLLLILPFFLFSQGQEENQEDAVTNNIQTTPISNTLIELNTLYHFIEDNFLFEIDTEDINTSLTKALLLSLDDPYSQYITKEDAASFEEDISGTYLGIGTYLTKTDPLFINLEDKETYMVKIVAPFSGGPADRAGIKAKDLVSHVNGESVFDLTATEASKLMRGKKEELITLTIHRGKDIFDISLYPEEVSAPNVEKTIIDNTNYGYIYIYDFTQATYSNFSNALIELEANNLDGLILDLRNNQGGIVDSALKIANFFLEKDLPLVTTEFKEGSSKKDFTTVSSNATRKYLNLPLVILTNEGTASASEILTAALSENNRAIIIGEKTFGKGIMQDVIAWKEGYIKLTTSHYLTPKGNNIHEKGITPDIEVIPESVDAKVFYSFLDEKRSAFDEFLISYPEYNDENVALFGATFETEEISSNFLESYISSEYISSLDYKDRPIIDLKYDKVLLEGISYLDNL